MADKSDGVANTSLSEFEGLVFGGDYRRAMAMLIKILEAFEGGADVSSGGAKRADAEAAQRACTRLGAAIVTLFTKDNERLEPEFFDLLAFHNRHLAAIFRLSGFGSPGYLYEILRGARPRQSDEGTAARVLSAYSVAAPAEIDWRDLLSRHGGISSSAYLAQFTHRAPLSREAEVRRESLLALAPLLEGCALRQSQLPVLSQAWMFCSYLDAPNRHDFKRPLNGLIRGYLESAGLRPAATPNPRRVEDRPTLVVIADMLTSWHAMYKTYANFLKQLRTRFKLVLVAMDGRTDDVARSLFDETVGIENGPSAIAEIVARVKEVAPALVYYPSVGMSVTSVVLCNLRLAPIQLASVGHPATTHSQAIDYIVMGHEYFSDAARFSERVLLLRSTGALFEATLDAKPLAPEPRKAPTPLRIAISSATVKLNAGFLTLCERLAAEAGRALEFHFFPNETGLRHRECERRIQQVVPGAIVHRRVGYDEYMARMNDCDMRLGTFPFGGANTTMDAFLLGIPTVVHEGPEPHSRTDMRFIGLFGLPDWLIARDTGSYLKAALRIIRDDEERVALSRQILDANPAAVLFEGEQNDYPSDFVDTLWWAYANHDRIIESERRVWRWEDRKSFPAE